ncbi:MAG: hypothetical protein ACM33T_07900 [Solirubrobacterales bacterium]
MQRISLVAVALTALALAGCGTTKTDRALSGGAIGAGVGAGTAAVTGGNVLGGAAIGGAGGAAAGALTEKKDLNLGEPLWRR